MLPITLESFFMVLGRMTGLFLIAPVFANRQMPARIKILIVIVLSGAMAYYVPVNYSTQLTTPAYFIAALVMEVVVGYTIGLVAYVCFGAIQLAGQIMDMQMGFAIVNVVDPMSGTQVPLMGNFSNLLALLIYLSINGHHYLLQAVAQSYKVIPVLGTHIHSNFMGLLVDMMVYMFVIAVKISAPVVIAILTTNIAMGFVARTVPQMNVFMVGIPLNIFMGIIAFLAMLPVYVWFMGTLFEKFFGYLDQIILALRL
ncbi:MAG TPA: flagellar biosynthetic protein FliR [Syntrophomonadaceae bacterium]|nr:flagellar biosynthetic protein FliR [Syntrophomonadaceae bacterium]